MHEPSRPAPPIERLTNIMAKLRDPDTGCPWDKEQTFETIAPYTIEEAYEVADAIDRRAMEELKDELGDLLLQVVYHSRMAEELGLFALNDVITAICDKMVRRHPHVFGGPDDGDTVDADHKARWETLKAHERGEERSALAGVAIAMPALTRAEKIQRRASRVGFDWPDATGARAKIDEELAECEHAETSERRSEEIGDLLFSVVNWSRHLGIDPEQALKQSTRRFQQRFEAMEKAVAPGQLSECDPQKLEMLWVDAKRQINSL